MSKLSWPEKNLNSFLTEEATHTHPGFASLESSRQSGYKYFLSILQNRRESAIPKLNTKVYENRKKPRFHAQNVPAFSHAVRAQLITRTVSIKNFVNNERLLLRLLCF